MRECGLKLLNMSAYLPPFSVTPHAGVWIEILCVWYLDQKSNVTPHAGVWIEIIIKVLCGAYGLVTPHAGVWIEMLF